jgi:uncharacterized repeat protein (TIGR01451 family)
MSRRMLSSFDLFRVPVVLLTLTLYATYTAPAWGQAITSADLALTKTDSADPVDTSAAFSYTLSVRNLGPSAASNVIVTDTLPAGVTFVRASGNQWTCTRVAVTVTCTRSRLNAGTTRSIRIDVIAPSVPGTLVNAAVVTSTTADPNPANNAASQTTTVQGAFADLSVTKTDSADPVNVGAPFSYTVTVRNAGPSTASNLTLTDTLPAGVTFVSASGGQWTCSQSAGVVTCTRPSLNAGMTRSVTINVTAPSQAGTIVNNAAVTSSTTDPNPANNAASESTTIRTAVTGIFVADPYAAGGTGAIIRIDPTTGSQTMISSGGLLVTPFGVALENTGTIVVADANAFGGSGGVIRIDPTTGAQTAVSSGGVFIDPRGIVVEANGQLLVSDDGGPFTSGGIVRVDPVSGAQTVLSTGGFFVDPTHLALEGSGATIVVADRIAFGGRGGIIRVVLATGTQTVVSSGGNFGCPQGVAVEAAGTLVSGTDTGCPTTTAQIIRVDPVAGTQTVVSNNVFLMRPIGLAIEADNNIIVADLNAGSGSGGIIRVDPVTGMQQLLSTGGLLVAPVGITVSR